MGEEVRVVTWQEGHDRLMRPDVSIVRHAGASDPEPSGSGMVATLEPIAIPFAAAVDEVRDTWIEIRRLPDERLVTAIEVLSPTNKGSSGLTEYLEKRHRLRIQGVNLVEIDLLIAGRRLPMAKPLPPGHFFTIISRASRSDIGDVYAWSIERRLPKIPIPLEDPDPDVFLDLAEVFALAYERGRYARLIDYDRPLDLPLHPQDKDWAEKVRAGKTKADFQRSGSLDRAIVGGLEKHRLHFADQRAVLVALGVDFFPLGIITEFFPCLPSSLAVGEGD